MGIRVAMVLLVAALPAHARADRVYVPPAEQVAGDQTVGVEITQTAYRALLDQLRASGHELLSGYETEAQLPDDQRGCRRSGCLLPVLRSLTCDAAVVLSVWSENDERYTVTVAFVGAEGERFSGSGQGRVNELAEAVAVAIEHALSRQLMGPGPWLVLEGQPEGAQVLVNGEALGQLPGRFQVPAGVHALEVSAPGYRAQSHRITVAAGTDSATQLRVELRPDRYGLTVNGLVLAVGAGMGAVGLGILIPSLTRLFMGDRIDEASLEIQEANVGLLGTLSVLGVALIATGVIFGLLAFDDVGTEQQSWLQPSGDGFRVLF
ncbi:MAG: PEGA domain-containing protein [Myxococcota bacterium]